MQISELVQETAAILAEFLPKTHSTVSANGDSVFISGEVGGRDAKFAVVRNSNKTVSIRFYWLDILSGAVSNEDLDKFVSYGKVTWLVTSDKEVIRRVGRQIYEDAEKRIEKIRYVIERFPNLDVSTRGRGIPFKYFESA
jgi:hypothetical protein